MSNAQAEFESKFHETVGKRADAREALRNYTAAIPRLKADAAQASADLAKLRADARAAGVKLPKLARASAPTIAASVPYEPGDESEDGED